jgi:hypothetical protein
VELIMTWLFLALAGLSLCGTFVNAVRHDGYMMAWSAAICLVWVLAALWSLGRLG